ncbi:hypothetical protein [Rubinisphaera sp. JC750]|uniref:hypothetical protein n=1 Tax=Rubinisphaera sp. JC750 TaxID=2898658 RepID=UPI001F2F736D|nr:hypothetical protein [Rubinisphaera sp. JC750]
MKKTVFIADEDISIDSLVRVVQRMDKSLDITLCSSIESAIPILRSRRFDALVFDLWLQADTSALGSLPDDSSILSGYYLYKFMQKDDACQNKNTPYAILTGLSISEHPKILDLSKQLNRFFIQKPVRPRQFIDIINELITKR